MLRPGDVEQGRQHVHGGNHVSFVDRSSLGHPRPANDPRGVSAVVVQLRLGKRQRHPVVGEEHHDRVFGFATLVECLEDFAHAIISTPHAGIVQGEFLPHFRIVEKKTGNRHFVRLENPRRHMRILATTLDLAPKRLVRIGHIHHKTKRLTCGLGLLDSIGRGDPERLGILVVPF